MPRERPSSSGTGDDAVLPVAAGITGEAYTNPVLLQQGFTTAVLIAAAMCAAGGLLAAGLMAYLTGQAFGAGVAAPPLGTSAAQAVFSGVFADLDAATSARADRIAQGTWALALTTIVVFPPVIGPPAPVT